MYEIDQEVNIFRSKVLKEGGKGLSLEGVITNLTVHKRKQSKGGVVYITEIEYLELYYEDSRAVYHILITKEMYGDFGISTVWAILIMVFGCILTGFLPTFLWIEAHDILEENFTKLSFVGLQLSCYGYIISTFFGFKFAGGFVSYVIGFLIIFFPAVGRLIPVFISSSNLCGKLDNWKTGVYLVLGLLINIIWLVLIWFKFKRIFRTFWVFSLLVILDLCFCEKKYRSNSYSRSKSGVSTCYLCFIVLGIGLSNQLNSYIFYFFLFWVTHGTAPPSILTRYVLVDVVVCLLMIAPFFIRFTCVFDEVKKIFERCFTAVKSKSEKQREVELAQRQPKKALKRRQSTQKERKKEGDDVEEGAKSEAKPQASGLILPGIKGIHALEVDPELDNGNGNLKNNDIFLE